MGRVVVIGEEAVVSAYSLAGAQVEITSEARPVRAVWAALPADTVLAVLSSTAAAQLGDQVASRPEILRVVLGR